MQQTSGSVSVVADTCTLADALPTTFFVLGPQAGLKFAGTLTKAAALFVVREADGSFRTVTGSRFANLTGYPPPGD